MCAHEWIKINDVIACGRCGLTRTDDGRVIFDRKLTAYFRKKKRKKKK